MPCPSAYPLVATRARWCRHLTAVPQAPQPTSMLARYVLTLGLCLGFCLSLTACATVPTRPERPLIVQLAISGSQGKCDWSLRQEPDDQPDLAALGSSQWPRTIPRPQSQKGARNQPLLAYGTSIHTQWTKTGRHLCLTLHKRQSVFITGVPPVAVVQIAPDGPLSHVTALASDPAISRLILQITPTSGSAQNLDLDLSQGRAEAHIAPPSPGQRTDFLMMAVDQGGASQAQRALTLISSQPNRPTRVMVQGRTLTIQADRP